MKRFNGKSFMIGLIIGALVFSSMAVAFAASYTANLKAYYRDIKVYVDDRKIGYTASNGAYAEPFIVDGTTYIPLRLFSEKLGKNVLWDEKTNSIYIGKHNETEKHYQLYETWTVDGLFSVRVNSIKVLSDRNEYYDGEEPAQVVLIDYTYENLGINDEYMGGLFVDVDKVMDSGRNMCQTYPSISVTKYAQPTPIGGICNAQTAYGLKTVGSPIKVYFSVHDENYNEYTAVFELENPDYL